MKRIPGPRDPEDNRVIPPWLHDLRQHQWLRKNGSDWNSAIDASWTSAKHRFASWRYLLSRHIGDMAETPGLRDKAFNKHSRNSGHHISPLGNGRVQVGTDGIVVRLVQGIDTDNLKRVLSMTTRATIGWDPESGVPGDEEHCEEFKAHVQIGLLHGEQRFAASDAFHCSRRHSSHIFRQSSPLGTQEYAGIIGDNRDWEEMLRGGLQTALESQVIVFAVSGVSRTCTHQLVRTRKAAFHQSSQRASYLGDQPEMRVPESVWRKGPELVRQWLDALDAAHAAYRAACEADVAYQDARFILPEGTDNFIVLEYPLRELIAVYNYRACYMFQWEISHVMHECKRVLLESIEDEQVRAAIDRALRISCEKTGPSQIPIRITRHGQTINAGVQMLEHHCTFQGWESPEGQCPLPWAKDEARTFKPQHHNI